MRPSIFLVSRRARKRTCEKFWSKKLIASARKCILLTFRKKRQHIRFLQIFDDTDHVHTNIDSIQQLSTMIWFSSDSFKFRTNFKCFTLSKLSACFLFCLRRHIYDVQFASRASARLRSFSVLSFLLPIWLSLSFRIAIFTTFTWKCCFKLVVVQHIFAPILLCPGNFANENSKSKSMDEWILWYSKFEWCVRACAYFVSFNFRYGSFACVFIYSLSLWWPERDGECPPTCFEGNSISII